MLFKTCFLLKNMKYANKNLILLLLITDMGILSQINIVSENIDRKR